MISTATSMTTTERLARERFIFDAAVAMGAHVHLLYQQHEGLRYPVLSLRDGEPFMSRGGVVYRWTSFAPEVTHAAGGKYKWLPAMPEDKTWGAWYAGLNVRSAVQKANGVCYLANGEKSLWSFHAAGIFNVIATTLSETSVPERAVDTLKELGVRQLLYAYDNDDAGRKSAQVWFDAFWQSDVKFSVLRWAQDLSSLKRGYDANDLLIEVGGDKDAFAIALASLPVEDVTPTPRYTHSASVKRGSVERGSVINYESLASDIVSEVERRGGKLRGSWTTNIRCPNPAHADTHPSFGVNRDGVGHCFVCGSMSVLQVADYLQIDLSPHTLQRRKQQSSAPTRLHSDDKRALGQSETSVPRGMGHSETNVPSVPSVNRDSGQVAGQSKTHVPDSVLDSEKGGGSAKSDVGRAIGHSELAHAFEDFDYNADDLRYVPPPMPRRSELKEVVSRWQKTKFDCYFKNPRAVDIAYEVERFPLWVFVALAQYDISVAVAYYKLNYACARDMLDFGFTLHEASSVLKIRRATLAKLFDVMLDKAIVVVGERSAATGRKAKLYALLEYDIDNYEVRQDLLAQICLNKNVVAQTIDDTESRLGVKRSALIAQENTEDPAWFRRIFYYREQGFTFPVIADALSLREVDFVTAYLYERIAREGDKGLRISQKTLAFELNSSASLVSQRLKRLKNAKVITALENSEAVKVDFDKFEKRNIYINDDVAYFERLVKDAERKLRGRAAIISFENYLTSGEKTTMESYNLLVPSRKQVIADVLKFYRDNRDANLVVEIKVKQENTYKLTDAWNYALEASTGGLESVSGDGQVSSSQRVSREASKHILPRFDELPDSVKPVAALRGVRRFVDFVLRVTSPLALNDVNQVVHRGTGVVVFEHAIECFETLREKGMTADIKRAIHDALKREGSDALSEEQYLASDSAGDDFDDIDDFSDFNDLNDFDNSGDVRVFDDSGDVSDIDYSFLSEVL